MTQQETEQTAPLMSPYRHRGDRRILIAQTYVTRYRAAFYEALKERLALEGVRLDVVYGDPTSDALKKLDSIELQWAVHRPNRYIHIGSRALIYQPIVKLSRAYDLVVVEQANKLIVNPILIGMNSIGMVRLAFWGHGKDFQGGDGRAGALIKRLMLPLVHWWFAYNDISAAIVGDAGFPNERITRVMNTIDNQALENSLLAITPQELQDQRQRFRLRGENVCIFIGSMYDKKRLTFLLEACTLIRQAIPDFEVIFLGGGVDKPIVDRFAAKHEWVIVRGPTFEREKALNLKLAKLMLMPGLVGLAIIDAFAAQVPIVTTDIPYHSPEIEYLIDDVNGRMVSPGDRAEEYARSVVALLGDENRLAKLRRGCREAAQKYTMRAMVSNFAEGVLGALKA